MVKVEGTLSRVVFANSTTGFAVVRLDQRSDGTQVTAVGPMAHVGVGEEVTLFGRWVTDPRHGVQLRVSECQHHPPTSVVGIERYLGSGQVKGVGPSTARKLVEAFGADTLAVMENEPHRLREIRGLGASRIEKILKSFASHKELRDLLVFLATHGISRNLALKIHRHYQDRAMAVVQTDPYRLIQDVRGVGFRTADSIARRLGIPEDSVDRIRAAADHTLTVATMAGHCFLPRSNLVRDAAQLLGLPETTVEAGLSIRSGHVVVETITLDDGAAYTGEDPDLTVNSGGSPGGETGPVPVLYPADLHSAECEVAVRVTRIAASRPVLTPEQVVMGLAGVEVQHSLKFHPLQREGLARLAEGNVLVITGGPGTGKTTLLKGVIEILRTANLDFALAAPTGRAAKRMEESTRIPALTLHRLLKFQPRGGFMVNAQAPLTVDACVIDEASMVDLTLFCSLLRGLKERTLLVLVGDVDQLPSIGPGAVLADLISAGIPTVQLTHVFRQSSESLIIRNAHRINRGELPELPPRESVQDADFFYVERESPSAIVDTVMEVVCERIPRAFGLNPKTDVQVLVPMYRGEVGVDNLNRQLRDRLNASTDLGESTDDLPQFRPGDKVIQTQNDYDREVTNGDIGLIVEEDADSGSVVVDFDGRRVAYRTEDLDQLALAYAVSVHKSQGSEYPAVVIPLHTSHFLLLQRNLVYTALTRARKLAVLIGSRRALEIAVQNRNAQRRYTQLARRVRAALSGRLVSQ